MWERWSESSATAREGRWPRPAGPISISIVPRYRASLSENVALLGSCTRFQSAGAPVIAASRVVFLARRANSLGARFPNELCG